MEATDLLRFNREIDMKIKGALKAGNLRNG
jgi:hypothetical protein